MTSQQIFSVWTKLKVNKALLYTHTSKTKKSQCFPLLLWTEVQPVHTPVRTQAYGSALSQSNFSILSVFCLVYNKSYYHIFSFFFSHHISSFHISYHHIIFSPFLFIICHIIIFSFFII